VVSSIVNFGAFVDLGGVDGLVHVSELSWKHVDHPSEVVEVGQEVDVEVLDVDLERERVSLSLKATQEDPWRQFARQHEVGDIIEGRVTKLVPFGAFVEVDDAIEGLVHISELADHHVERAEDEVGVHDKVEVKIIDIDLDRRRISLSRKQAMKGAGEPIEVTTGATGVPAAEAEERPAEAEMELEGDDDAKALDYPAEDPVLVPEADEEILTSAEEAGDILTESAAPEVSDPIEAMAAAPEEEKEEAELEAMMSPDTPKLIEPTGIDGRLSQEEPDVDPEAVGETLESDEEPAEESLESIVEELKRERGQQP
jgi:predicted RNA-binding protein with RPS1 domain